MSIFEELESGRIIDSPQAMRNLGADLVRAGPEVLTLALVGDLGAGKTTLVQGIGLALGYGEVNSPSFLITQVYTDGDRDLIHVDAWRLEGPAAYDALLIDEQISGPSVVAIEWADRVAPALPEDTIWLELGGDADGPRRVRRIASPSS